MMIEVSLVGGVTKSTITNDEGLVTNKIGGNILNESRNVITFRFLDGTVGAFQFEDFVDNLGASTSSELVDALLVGGYFENSLLAAAGSGAGNINDVNITLGTNDLSDQNPIPNEIIQDGEPVGYYRPLSINEQVLSETDVDYSNSDFTGWSGTYEDHMDLFRSPFSGYIENTTASTKIIEVGFSRTQGLMTVGLGANAGVGFKNVKIEGVGSDGTIRTVVPESSEEYTGSFNFEFNADIFNKARITFNTVDPITISNISLRKFQYTSSQLRGRSLSGRYRDVAVSEDGNLQVDFPRDIFGNLSVAEQFGLFDNSRVFSGSIDLFWTDLIIGAGSNTYDKATSKTVLAVTTTGDVSATQLKHRLKYQPLKAHKSAVSGLFSQEVGVEKYVGLFDLDNHDEPTVDGTIYNGVPFKITEDDCFVQIWNNGVLAIEVARDSWNIDKLDGTGASGIVLDLNYAQILLCEIEWLGVGSVRFIFNIEGKNVPVHQVDNANFIVQDVYMRTANLPICYMIKSVGGAGSLKVICNSIVSGGGHNPVGIPRFIENKTSVNIAGDNHEALLFMRLKPESFEGTVNLRGFKALVESSGDSVFRLLYNPSWGGSAITWVDLPNSHIQYAVATGDNNIINEGIPMDVDYASSDSDASGAVINSSLKLGKALQTDANQEGRYDIICLSSESFGGTEVYYGAIQFEDIF